MPLTELDRGDKVDFHVKLYEREADILDAICKRYNTSRSAVIGQLLRDYDEKEPIIGLPSPARGRRANHR